MLLAAKAMVNLGANLILLREFLVLDLKPGFPWNLHIKRQLLGKGGTDSKVRNGVGNISYIVVSNIQSCINIF